MGGIFLISYNRYFAVDNNIGGWYFFTLAITALIFALRYFFKFKNKVRNKNQKPLKEVKAEILTIKTSRAIKREDNADFGSAFYLDVKESKAIRKTLFLWGQYLDVLAFPNTEFRIIRRSDTKCLINIELTGNYFEPEKTIRPFSDEIWIKREFPIDGDILNMTICRGYNQRVTIECNDRGRVSG